MTNLQATRATIFTPSLLLLLWVAINLMDGALTLSHIAWGGLEGNPLHASVQASLGTGSMVAAKMTGAMVVGLVLARMGRYDYLSLANAGMAIVVLYNAALVPFAISTLRIGELAT